MAIFHFLGVTAVLFLIYALLLVGCEKKIIFHPSKFPEGNWDPASKGLKVQDIDFQSKDGKSYMAGLLLPPKLGLPYYGSTVMLET